MRELIAITDVTEMWASQVCIAGVTQELDCIRPVVEGGVQIWDLYKDDQPIIFPGAKVWMDFSPAQIAPPHIEDRAFDPQTVEYKDAFKDKHWETLLRKTSHDSVHSIFDGNLNERRVAPGTLTRSLGTISNVRILNLSVDLRHEGEGRRVLRMAFKDASDNVYKGFPVNDLAFRGVFKQLLRSYRTVPRAVSSLLERLKKSDRTYLRIGLARPTRIGRYPETCWVQVTGVYTFPDYLDGIKWSAFK